MKFFEFMFVPTILFLTVVVPIWLTMHYRSLNRSSRTLNAEDRVAVEQMLETLDKLSDRIEALESILDADHPEWRGRDPGRAKPDDSERSDDHES